MHDEERTDDLLQGLGQQGVGTGKGIFQSVYFGRFRLSTPFQALEDMLEYAGNICSVYVDFPLRAGLMILLGAPDGSCQYQLRQKILEE